MLSRYGSCCLWGREPGSDAAAGQQTQYDDNQRDDEKNMNEPASDMKGETKEPQNQQEHDYRPQHG